MVVTERGFEPEGFDEPVRSSGEGRRSVGDGGPERKRRDEQAQACEQSLPLRQVFVVNARP